MTHSIPVRVAGVEAYIHADYNAAKAVRELKQHITSSEFRRIAAPRKFVKNLYAKLQRTGGVQDNYGRKRKAPEPGASDDVALRAAKVLKAGYRGWQEIPSGKKNKPPKVVPVHMFWGSMKDCVARSHKMSELLLEAGCTPKALLKRMKKADPSLVRRTLHYKLHHTPGTIANRIRVCKSNLERAAADPKFLKRVVWIDETTIWLVNTRHYRRRVWCDAGDWDARRVVKCPMLAKGKPVKVHVMCAVNYYLGPFFMEFTTGTHGIKRLHIAEKAYRVSGCRHVYPPADCTIRHGACSQHIHST